MSNCFIKLQEWASKSSQLSNFIRQCHSLKNLSNSIIKEHSSELCCEFPEDIKLSHDRTIQLANEVSKLLTELENQNILLPND